MDLELEALAVKLNGKTIKCEEETELFAKLSLIMFSELLEFTFEKLQPDKRRYVMPCLDFRFRFKCSGCTNFATFSFPNYEYLESDREQIPRMVIDAILKHYSVL